MTSVFLTTRLQIGLSEMERLSDRTHKAIHYGDDSILEPAFTERRPGDTCPMETKNDLIVTQRLKTCVNFENSIEDYEKTVYNMV